MVMLILDPDGIALRVQATVPVPPTGGAVQLPAVVTTLANVVPAGTVSVTETAAAVSGPLFFATIKYLSGVPLVTVLKVVSVTDMSAEGTTFATHASISPPLQLPSVPHIA